MALLVPRVAHTAALIVALPAHAQDTAMWNGTGCTLIPVDGQAHVAELRCHNALTGGVPLTEGAMIAGGLIVGLSIDHQSGDIPDTFMFAAPDGYAVVPPALVLNEHADGVAVVMPWTGF